MGMTVSLILFSTIRRKSGKSTTYFITWKIVSNNWQEQKVKIERIYEKNANKRIENLHKITNNIVTIYILIYTIYIKNIKNIRKKKKLKIEHINEKKANKRIDTLHQISTKLVKNHDLIGLETLRVKKLVQNQKLAKPIHDTSWSTFKNLLIYK